MKKYFAIFAIILLPHVFHGQVNFLNTSFEEALNRSSKSGLMIFLQFESAECERCNSAAYKAFEDETLANQLEEAFVCLKIDPFHPDRAEISKLYNIRGFGSFIIDQGKNLIHSYPASSSAAETYKKQIDIALTKAGEDSRVNDLENEFRKGNKSLGMIELLLQKRKSLNLETDSLLNDYVKLLPADSIGSPATVLFISQFAPTFRSPAYFFLLKDYAKFIQTWHTMSLAVKSSINSRIIYKSMKKAIREKDEQYAYRVAAFARSTHGNNSNSGTKSYDANLLAYYKGINDTIKYLASAVKYYNTHLMVVSVDSIKMRDSMSYRKLISGFDTIKAKNVKNGDRSTRTVRFAPSAQRFTSQLNEGAWNFYRMTSDPILLQTALQWVKRANEFWQSPEALDTWARLLYKTGNNKDAFQKLDEAIALQKKQGYPASTYETTLAKMKEGLASIDN